MHQKNNLYENALIHSLAHQGIVMKSSIASVTFWMNIKKEYRQVCELYEKVQKEVADWIYDPNIHIWLSGIRKKTFGDAEHALSESQKWNQKTLMVSRLIRAFLKESQERTTHSVLAVCVVIGELLEIVCQFSNQDKSLRQFLKKIDDTKTLQDCPQLVCLHQIQPSHPHHRMILESLRHCVVNSACGEDVNLRYLKSICKPYVVIHEPIHTRLLAWSLSHETQKKSVGNIGVFQYAEKKYIAYRPEIESFRSMHWNFLEIQPEFCGSGTYGTVHFTLKIAWNGSSYVAIIQKWSPDLIKITRIDEEVHPHIERYRREGSINQLANPGKKIFFFEERTKTQEFIFYIKQPYLSGCNLHYFLSHQKNLSVLDRIQIVFSLIENLKTLHQKNIAHRDLKPENCIIKKDARGFYEVRFIDFGFSVTNYTGKLKILNVGTRGFFPKKMFNKKKLNLLNIDTFAMYVLICEVLNISIIKVNFLSKSITYYTRAADYYEKYEAHEDDVFLLNSDYSEDLKKSIFDFLHQGLTEYWNETDALNLLHNQFMSATAEFRWAEIHRVFEKKFLSNFYCLEQKHFNDFEHVQNIGCVFLRAYEDSMQAMLLMQHGLCSERIYEMQQMQILFHLMKELNQDRICSMSHEEITALQARITQTLSHCHNVRTYSSVELWHSTLLNAFRDVLQYKRKAEIKKISHAIKEAYFGSDFMTHIEFERLSSLFYTHQSILKPKDAQRFYLLSTCHQIHKLLHEKVFDIATQTEKIKNAYDNLMKDRKNEFYRHTKLLDGLANQCNLWFSDHDSIREPDHRLNLKSVPIFDTTIWKDLLDTITIFQKKIVHHTWCGLFACGSKHKKKTLDPIINHLKLLISSNSHDAHAIQEIVSEFDRITDQSLYLFLSDATKKKLTALPKVSQSQRNIILPLQ